MFSSFSVSAFSGSETETRGTRAAAPTQGTKPRLRPSSESAISRAGPPASAQLSSHLCVSTRVPPDVPTRKTSRSIQPVTAGSEASGAARSASGNDETASFVFFDLAAFATHDATAFLGSFPS